MSVDGKGIVMRSEDLRPATRKAASERTSKLSKRRSKGEKAGTKRMAMVAAVDTVAPHRRSPGGVVRGAEAVLRLRSLRSSQDFDDDWRCHKQREHERNHQDRHAGSIPRVVRLASPQKPAPRHLRVVK